MNNAQRRAGRHLVEPVRGRGLGRLPVGEAAHHGQQAEPRHSESHHPEPCDRQRAHDERRGRRRRAAAEAR
jgi:hypothetical protein